MSLLSKIKRQHIVIVGVLIALIGEGVAGFVLYHHPTKESPRDDVRLGTDLINSRELYYVKDYRTDLCFAAHKFGWQNGLLTNVPCTPKVEDHLINRAR